MFTVYIIYRRCSKEYADAIVCRSEIGVMDLLDIDLIDVKGEMLTMSTNNTDKNNIWLSGIMGLVTGDALGSPAQFRSRSIFINNPITEMEYCKCFSMPPGSWTDDSSLAIATLDSLISEKGYKLEGIADNFVKWLCNDEYTPSGKTYDIGYGCESGIMKYRHTKDAKTSGGNDEKNNGNGSLMRIMPICLYGYELHKRNDVSDDEVIEMIHDVSGITHRHIRAKMACGLYFYMVKSILDNKDSEKKMTLTECLQAGIDAGMKYYGQDIGNLTELAYFGRLYYLDELENTSSDDIRSSGYVIDTIEAVVYNLITTKSFEDCLIKAVNMGGDADTVGAIAGGLAGLYYGYDAIPDRWISKIVRREYIENMCDEAKNIFI